MSFKKYAALIGAIAILGTTGYTGRIGAVTKRHTTQSKLEVMVKQDNWTGKGIGALLKFNEESNKENRNGENKNKEYLPPKIIYNCPYKNMREIDNQNNKNLF